MLNSLQQRAAATVAAAVTAFTAYSQQSEGVSDPDTSKTSQVTPTPEEASAPQTADDLRDQGAAETAKSKEAAESKSLQSDGPSAIEGLQKEAKEQSAQPTPSTPTIGDNLSPAERELLSKANGRTSRPVGRVTDPADGSAVDASEHRRIMDAMRAAPPTGPLQRTPTTTPNYKCVSQVTITPEAYEAYLQKVYHAADAFSTALLIRENHDFYAPTGNGRFEHSDIKARLADYPPIVTDPHTGQMVRALTVHCTDGRSMQPINHVQQLDGGTFEGRVGERSTPMAQRALDGFFDATTPERLAAALQELDQLGKGDAARENFPELWMDRSPDSARQLRNLLMPGPGRPINGTAVRDFLYTEFTTHGSFEHLAMNYERVYGTKLTSALAAVPEKDLVFINSLLQGQDLNAIANLLANDMPTGLTDLSTLVSGLAWMSPEEQSFRSSQVKVVRELYLEQTGQQLIDGIDSYYLGAAADTPDAATKSAIRDTHLNALMAIMSPEAIAINQDLQRNSTDKLVETLKRVEIPLAADDTPEIRQQKLALSALHRQGLLETTHALDPEGRSVPMQLFSNPNISTRDIERAALMCEGLHPRHVETDNGIEEVLASDFVRQKLQSSPPNYEALQKVFLGGKTSVSQCIAMMRAWELDRGTDTQWGTLPEAIEAKIPTDATAEQRAQATMIATHLRSLEVWDGLRNTQLAFVRDGFSSGGTAENLGSVLSPEQTGAVADALSKWTEIPYHSLIDNSRFGPSERAAARFLAYGVDLHKASMTDAEFDAIFTTAKTIYGEEIFTPADKLVGEIGKNVPKEAAIIKVISHAPAGKGNDFEECVLAILGAPPGMTLAQHFSENNMAAAAAKLEELRIAPTQDR